MTRAAAAVCFLVCGAASGIAFAQDSQAGDPNAPQSGVMERIKVDRAGGFHLTNSFAIVFGGIKEGSGAAAGPALSHDFADGSFTQVKAVYSIRQFKLLQARYDSRPLFGRRSTISTRVRWQDAPQLSLYRLGPESPRGRAEFGERHVEWSGFLRTAFGRHTSVTAGTGIERYATDGGWIDEGEDERLDVVPQVPGLGSRSWFVHSYAGALHDTRLSPGFTRTGHLLAATLHDYHDTHDGAESFLRLELAAAQHVPTFSARGAIGVGVFAWLSHTADGSYVPFFLMPTLGGGNFLEGYPSYRLRDRQALDLHAEYAWAVHPMFDVAAIYEAGTVASSVRGLTPRHMWQSAGGSVRLHTGSAALLRLDLARGREGVHFVIGFSTGS
jgi:outer membrane translocation and assembly module TamA